MDVDVGLEGIALGAEVLEALVLLEGMLSGLELGFEREETFFEAREACSFLIEKGETFGIVLELGAESRET